MPPPLKIEQNAVDFPFLIYYPISRFTYEKLTFFIEID